MPEALILIHMLMVSDEHDSNQRLSSCANLIELLSSATKGTSPYAQTRQRPRHSPSLADSTISTLFLPVPCSGYVYGFSVEHGKPCDLHEILILAKKLPSLATAVKWARRKPAIQYSIDEWTLTQAATLFHGTGVIHSVLD